MKRRTFMQAIATVVFGGGAALKAKKPEDWLKTEAEVDAARAKKANNIEINPYAFSSQKKHLFGTCLVTNENHRFCFSKMDR